MKKKILYSFCSFGLLSLLALPLVSRCQADSTKKPTRESLLYLKYHVKDNKVPYLAVQTKNKTDQGFSVAPNIHVSIYLDSDQSKQALIGDIVTDEKGNAIATIPPSLATAWDHYSGHTFYAHAKASPNFDAVSKDVAIKLARLQLDTASTADGKSVAVTLEKNEGGSWVPMPEVDVKIGIKRYGGILNVADDDTYATDSTGKAHADFLKANLPGDNDGNLQLVALVDDNEEVGTLESSTFVPWGVAHQFKTDFGKRSLWSTPRNAPIWLTLMAWACVIGVWSVIIYLITRILLIRKLGLKSVD